jgi:hypothetical protein
MSHLGPRAGTGNLAGMMWGDIEAKTIEEELSSRIPTLIPVGSVVPEATSPGDFAAS